MKVDWTLVGGIVGVVLILLVLPVLGLLLVR